MIDIGFVGTVCFVCGAIFGSTVGFYLWLLDDSKHVCKVCDNDRNNRSADSLHSHSVSRYLASNKRGDKEIDPM